jgi:hypothetical protein
LGYNFGSSMAREQGFDIRTDWLPTLASISPYFTPEMSAVSSDERGIVLTSASEGVSFNASPAVVAVGVSIARPSLNHARSQAKMVVAAADLNAMGKNVVLYAAENRDNYPPDLQALVKTGMSPAMLRSPFNPAPPPQLVDGKLVGESDYVYKYHPGYDPNLLEKIIEMNYSGIIFEGTGLGHIGKIMYDNVKKANEKGIFLGMTSQCIDGRVRMTVYESGRDLLNLGIISLENMIPEVALVKTMWALGNSETLEETKHIMLQNIASEISE